MPAVSCSGLVKRFGQRTAIDRVELRVAPGEVRGLLGPNGAGKTTLLRLLFGLIAPDEGAIELLGRPLHASGFSSLDAVGGFVEDPCFYPYLSGRANLQLLARLDGGAASAAEVELALERVDLGTRAGDRVSGYSTGMRQRLGIAAALLRRPRLLLLDEPTSGLDPAGARAVAGLVRELAGDGVAILLSSHQIGELERVCSSYTFLRSGSVAWDGTAAELEARAPVAAYWLETSDDERGRQLAGTVLEASGAAFAARRDHARDRARAARPARLRPRRRPYRDPSSRASGQPARDHVLRAHRRRARRTA